MNQQVRYFQKENQIQNTDIHEIFDNQLCQFIDNICNEEHNVVCGMDENDDIRRGKISKPLEEIGISEAIIKYYKDKFQLLLVKTT